MNKTRKSPPKFQTEAEEQRSWETHDSTPHIDWTTAKNVKFENLPQSAKRR